MAMIGLVGDVFVEREGDHVAPFRPVLDLLAAPDVLFGNFEGVLADDPEYAPGTGTPVFAPTANVAALKPAGFDVLVMANNHIVDCGHRAMLHTRDLIREQGIATAGVGENLAEAVAPAVVEAGGLRVATVSFATLFPRGYEAKGNMPGLAPVRAKTVVTELFAADYWAPENAVTIDSEELPGDVEGLRKAIEAAREQADVVIASFHWGDFTRPFVLTKHERRVARIAIDAGADVVAGHHHHALRGFEFYEGKPVVYGLGHFVFDQPTLCDRIEALSGTPAGGESPNLDLYATIAPREGWPYLPMHEDMRLTAFVYVDVEDGKPAGLGFVPCQLRRDGSVEAFGADDPEGKVVVDYVRRACEAESLPVVLEDGREVAGRRSVRVSPA